jgi:hypothetical protein
LTELEGTGQIYKTMLFTAKDMIDEVCDQVVGDIINSEELSRNWNRSGVRNVRSAAGKSERASVDEKSTDSRAEYARARESLRPSRLTGDTEMVERSDRLVHLGRQVKLIMDQRMSQMYTWLKGSCGENELVKAKTALLRTADAAEYWLHVCIALSIKHPNVKVEEQIPAQLLAQRRLTLAQQWSLFRYDGSSLQAFLSSVADYRERHENLGMVLTEVDLQLKLATTVGQHPKYALTAAIHKGKEFSALCQEFLAIEASAEAQKAAESVGRQGSPESKSSESNLAQHGQRPGDWHNDQGARRDMSKIKCFGCGKFGHMKSKCPGTRSQSETQAKSDSKCGRCGGTSHPTEKCFWCDVCKVNGHKFNSKRCSKGEVPTAQSGSGSASAAATPASKSHAIICSRCNKPGHKATQCRATHSAEGVIGLLEIGYAETDDRAYLECTMMEESAGATTQHMGQQYVTSEGEKVGDRSEESAAAPQVTTSNDGSSSELHLCMAVPNRAQGSAIMCSDMGQESMEMSHLPDARMAGQSLVASPVVTTDSRNDQTIIDLTEESEDEYKEAQSISSKGSDSCVSSTNSMANGQTVAAEDSGEESVRCHKLSSVSLFGKTPQRTEGVGGTGQVLKSSTSTQGNIQEWHNSRAFLEENKASEVGGTDKNGPKFIEKFGQTQNYVGFRITDKPRIQCKCQALGTAGKLCMSGKCGCRRKGQFCDNQCGCKGIKLCTNADTSKQECLVSVMETYTGYRSNVGIKSQAKSLEDEFKVVKPKLEQTTLGATFVSNKSGTSQPQLALKKRSVLTKLLEEIRVRRNMDGLNLALNDRLTTYADERRKRMRLNERAFAEVVDDEREIRRRGQAATYIRKRSAQLLDESVWQDAKWTALPADELPQQMTPHMRRLTRPGQLDDRTPVRNGLLEDLNSAAEPTVAGLEALAISNLFIKGALVLDSGASRTTTGSDELLIDERDTEIPVPMLTASDSKPLYITRTGTTYIQNVCVKNVLRHEAMRRTLVSVGQLCDQGIYVAFDGAYGVGFSLTKGKTLWEILAPYMSTELIFERTNSNGLYVMEDASQDMNERCLHSMPMEVNAATVQERRIQEVYDMHCKLGHISYNKLKTMVLKGWVTGVEHLKDFDWSPEGMRQVRPCDACMRGKIHDISHAPKSSREPITVPGEGLFADTSGKIDLKIDQSQRPELYNVWKLFGLWQYFDLLVDVASKKVWVQFFQHKDDVVEWRIHIVNRIQTQLGVKLKKLFMDKGGENRSGEFMHFMSANGIEPIWAPTNHKERQGQVERYMRTTMERAVAQVIFANLHPVFIKHAMFHVVHNLCMEAVGEGNVSRNEAFDRVKPKLSEAYVFGSDAVVLVEHYSKKDGRGAEAIYLGRSLDSEQAHVFLMVDTQKYVTTTRFDIIDGRFTFGRGLYASDASLTSMIKLQAAAQFDIEVAGSHLVGPPQISREAQSDWTAPQYDERKSTSKRSNEDIDSKSEEHSEIKSEAVEVVGTFGQPTKTRSGRIVRQVDLGPVLNNQYAALMENSSEALASDSKPWNDENIENLLGECVDQVMDNIVDRQLVAHESLLTQPGPATLVELLRLPKAEQDQHMAAFHKEDQGLYKNGTFDDVHESEIKSDDKVVSARVVHTIKIDENQVKTYKARVVARDYRRGNNYYLLDKAEQREKMLENYSPVAKAKSIRILQALCAILKLNMHQIDIVQAFLHAFYTKGTVYVRPPKGYYPKMEKEGMVWRLVKSLYGLQDAPKEWYKHFKAYLLEHGFVQLRHIDECVFHKNIDKESIVILCVYVDDNLAGISKTKAATKWWNDFLKATHARFGIKDLGVPKYCLGINIDVRDDCEIIISQHTYIDKALERFSLIFTKAADVPMETPSANEQRQKEATYKQSQDKVCEVTEQNRVELYRQMVGTLLYAAIMTRPDIALAVNHLSRVLIAPSEHDIERAKQVFRYLKTTKMSGIRYYSKDAEEIVRITAMSDASWADNKLTSKTTFGYITYLNGLPINWRSGKSDRVYNSTTDAEYCAASDCSREIKWTSNVLDALNIRQAQPILYCDCQPAIFNILNESISEALKHVRISFHVIKEYHENNEIEVRYIPTKENVADIFTKALDKQLFKPLVRALCYQPP